MGKSAPSPPPPPDYAAAAKEQGAANVDAARVGAALNRVDQYTPWGNLTYAKNPTGGPDSWTQTLALSPDQQKILDNQNQGEVALGDTAISGINRLQDSFGTDFNPTLPNRVTSVDGGGPYAMYNGSTAAPVSQLDFSSLGAVPGANDFGAQKQEVEDTLYKQATSKLDPQYAQMEDQLRSRLINSGVAEGSEAWNNAMGDFNRQRQADYGDARDRAILAGGNEQSRLNSDALSSRAQMLSQILQGGQFTNSAQEQTFNNDLAKLGFNNTNLSQQLADAITKGNFQNQQRGAALDEAAYMRNQPLNEFNALMSGAQIANPGFSGVPQVASPAAAPVFAAAQAQGQNALDLYNAQAAGANSANSGILGLAGTLGGSAIRAF